MIRHRAYLMLIGAGIGAILFLLTVPAYADTPTITVDSHKVVQSSTLPSCAYEDGSGGPLPCSWNLNEDTWQTDGDGNKRGLAYFVTGTPRHMTYHYVWDGQPNVHGWHFIGRHDARIMGTYWHSTKWWRACVTRIDNGYRSVKCPDGWGYVDHA